MEIEKKGKGKGKRKKPTFWKYVGTTSLFVYLLICLLQSSPQLFFRLRSSRLLRKRIQLLFSTISFASTALHLHAHCRIFHYSARAHGEVMGERNIRHGNCSIPCFNLIALCFIIHLTPLRKAEEGFSGKAMQPPMEFPLQSPLFWYLRLMINQICTPLLSSATSSPIS